MVKSGKLILVNDVAVLPQVSLNAQRILVKLLNAKPVHMKLEHTKSTNAAVLHAAPPVHQKNVTNVQK